MFNKNTGKWLKGSLDKDGYLRYHLQREGVKSKTYRAHRLSMITFKFVEGFSELEVNHKDGDKLNNNIENLEWCSAQENIVHSIETELRDPKAKALITIEECHAICKLLEDGYAPKMIAQKMFPEDVNRFNSIILDIKRKRNWIDISSDYNVEAEYRYGASFRSNHTIWKLEEICEKIANGEKNKAIAIDLFEVANKSNQDLISGIKNKRKYTNVSKYFF